MGRLTQRSDSFAGPVQEIKSASALKGTDVTTTASLTVIPDGAGHIVLMPRNFSTAVVVGIGLTPYVSLLTTSDAMATITDQSVAAQDGLSGTVVTLDDLPAAGGAIYVGAQVPFRGLAVTIGSANANAAALSAEYWNGSAWASLSITDGTDDSGATFGQTGNITWTVPAAWAQMDLESIFQSQHVALGAWLNNATPLYWLRFAVDADLSASVEATAALALCRSTSYAGLVTGESFAARVNKGVGGVAAVEAVTDAGTANLIVDAIVEPGGMFTS